MFFAKRPSRLGLGMVMGSMLTLAAVGAEGLLDRLVVPHQVHGDHVVSVRSAEPAALAAGPPPGGAGAPPGGGPPPRRGMPAGARQSPSALRLPRRNSIVIPHRPARPTTE